MAVCSHSPAQVKSCKQSTVLGGYNKKCIEPFKVHLSEVVFCSSTASLLIGEASLDIPDVMPVDISALASQQAQAWCLLWDKKTEPNLTNMWHIPLKCPDLTWGTALHQARKAYIAGLHSRILLEVPFLHLLQKPAKTNQTNKQAKSIFKLTLYYNALG